LLLNEFQLFPLVISKKLWNAARVAKVGDGVGAKVGGVGTIGDIVGLWEGAMVSWHRVKSLSNLHVTPGLAQLGISKQVAESRAGFSLISMLVTPRAMSSLIA